MIAPFEYPMLEWVTCPGLYPIAQETVLAAPTLCTEYGPNGWIFGIDIPDVFGATVALKETKVFHN